MNRPSFGLMQHFFIQINLPVKNVGEKIGGHVQQNIESGIFKNACPIRMSYVLNNAGYHVRNLGYKVVTGADKRIYLYHVNDMIDYLKRTLGKPDKVVKNPKSRDFIGMKGIIIFTGSGWSDAAGHVTLWNGSRCLDSCHFLGDPNNGTFIPDTAFIWILK